MPLIERLRHMEWRKLIPPAIILGVMVTSALFGLRASPRLIFFVAAILVSGIALNWLTRHIEWGILILIPVTFLIPYGLSTGTQTSLNLSILLSLLLIGIWVMRMLVIERQVVLVPSPVNLPALLFIVTVILSFVASALPWLPLVSARASTFSQVGGILMLVLPLGVLLLVGNLIRDEKWLHWMVWLFCAFGGFYLAGLLIFGGDRLSNIYNDKSVSALFYVWIVAISGGMVLFNQDLNRRWRWAMGGLLVLAILIGLGPMRSSASSWAPALISLGVLLAIKWWRLGVFFVFTGGVGIALRFPLVYETLLRTEEYSAVTRAATWPIMYQLVKASPLLGLGPSNYYFYTSHFSLLGYYVQFNSHNNYWDLAAQVGLLGLGLFLWLAYVLGRSAWKLRSRSLNGFQRSYVNAGLAGLVGTLASGMLADWFMPFVYNIGFDGFRGAIFAWLFLGGIIALERITASPRR